MEEGTKRIGYNTGMIDSPPHRLVHLTHPEAHIPGHQMPETAAPPPTRGQLVGGFLLVMAVAIAGFTLEHWTHHAEDATITLPWLIPFGLLLGSIAVMPFVARHFWEHHYHQVSLALGLLVAVYYFAAVEHGPANIGRSVSEYISFIFLLGSLFVVSGGILIRVRARATPLANVVLLGIGAIIANLFGTTGASMLLIRPYLRMNKAHLRPYHVVFFIFIVSNVGGSLTPIGDPPLFLGYLLGVPFTWVFEHCWPIWILVNGLLLIVFGLIDARSHWKEPRQPYNGNDPGPVVSLYGVVNLLFVALIVAGILLHGQLNAWTRRHLGFEGPWRELLMIIAAFGSLVSTPPRVHGDNHFNYLPIKEVAYLFAGIFLTMVPALNYLAQNAPILHVTGPTPFYFATGGLSSVLDNAPTYQVFFQSLVHRYDGGLAAVLNEPAGALMLVGISMGAVLFGAMTYIGNGPNFMVRSIADHAGAQTPGFFRYIYAFSLPVLLPILLLVWVLFLR